MTTKRVPISRDAVRQVTPAAAAAFRKMQSVWEQCTCPDPDEDGRRQRCTACTEWWAANSVLCDELRLPAWWFPAVEPPDAECPYEAGTFAAKQWIKDRSNRLEAINLYNALDAALNEPSGDQS